MTPLRAPAPGPCPPPRLRQRQQPEKQAGRPDVLVTSAGTIRSVLPDIRQLPLAGCQSRVRSLQPTSAACGIPRALSGARSQKYRCMRTPED
jgi:hypothetical protein